jgi:hypothetical protein
MVAASGGDVTPDQIRDILESMAWKPDSWDESQANAVIDDKDSRYGKGIVDAYAAVAQVAMDTGVTGVVESESQPVDGATVELNGSTVTTDASGGFEIVSQPGDYDLTVTGPGIVDKTVGVTVQDSGSLTDVGIIAVDPKLDVFLDSDQASEIEGGETLSATLDAYNLESLQVQLTGTYDEGDATLTVDGQTVAFGETVSFSDYTGAVSVTVETTAETDGDIGLDHLATGAGDQTTVASGPTTVFASLLDVGVVYDGTSYGSGIVETLDQVLPGRYRPVATTTDSVVQNPEAYGTIVAQKLDSSLVSEFVSVTDAADVGVVYLDQWGADADAISQYASESANLSSTSQTDFEGGPYYDVAGTNPIFDGVSVDTDVLLHEGDYGDCAWFDTADGIDVLAATKTDDGVKGDGLAIHDETRTIFAATLGRSRYVPDNEFTNAADTILANAVRYVAGSETDVSATATYENGTVDVSIDGTNVGEITVGNMWADWMAADADYGSNFDDSIATEGACAWSWSDPYGWVAPTMTAELPDRYVGGTYALTVSGQTSQGDSVETTATFEIE